MNLNTSQNYINHIAFVIDQSGSMAHLEREVVKVTDNQVQYLAQRSKELDQETRATTYLFDDKVQCVHYDKDVLRLPSLSHHYRPTGMTSLIDATMQAINDLQKTPELYGDHAFLIFVITDGAENASRKFRQSDLSSKLKSLPDHWTVAVLAPNQIGVHEAKRFGFPAHNISVWDASSAAGFAEAGNTIRRATDNWMQNRAKGVRGSSNLFQMDVSKLNNNTVQSNLRRLNLNQYDLFNVLQDDVIRPFVEARTGSYRTGSAYYQITKPETIQANKSICIRDRNNGTVFTGQEARQLLGLPDFNARVKPSDHSQYDVFVQSTSVNRKLIGGTQVLVMH